MQTPFSASDSLKVVLALIFVMILPFTAAADSSHAPPAPSNGQVIGLDTPSRVPGSYIVILDRNPEAGLDQIHQDEISDQVIAKVDELSMAYGGRVKNIYTHAIHGFAVTDLPEAAAHAMAKRLDVELVQTDQIGTVAGSQNLPPPNLEAGYWGLDRIDQTSPGTLDQTYNYPNSGYRSYALEAFVLDSGIDASHPGFGGRVQNGWDATTQSTGATTDCQGHGTKVAGVIGSAAYGVAKGARLVPVKITTGCTGTTHSSDVIEAVDWVFMRRQSDAWVSNGTHYPAVVTMSNTGGDDVQAVRSAFENLATYNPLRTLVVVAAGNHSSNKVRCSEGVPGDDTVGNSPHILNVGATYIKTSPTEDRIWEDSGDGICVDLFAPGVGIRTTVPVAFPGNSWGIFNGTSYAAPFVSGAALLYAYNNQYATSSDIMSVLKNNALQDKVKGAVSPNDHLLNIEFMLP